MCNDRRCLQKHWRVCWASHERLKIFMAYVFLMCAYWTSWKIWCLPSSWPPVRYIRARTMTMKNQSVLLLLGKPYKDAPVAEALGFTDLDDTSLYIFFERNIHFIFQTADAYVKNVHTPDLSNAISFNGQARGFLDKLPVCRIEQDQEKLPVFALHFWYQNWANEVHLSLHYVAPYDDHASVRLRCNGKKGEVKEESWDTRGASNGEVQAILQFCGDRFFKARSFERKVLPETLQKKSARMKLDGNMAQAVVDFNVDDQEVAFIPKKGARLTGQSLNEAPKDTWESREDNVGPTKDLAFDDSLSDKLLPGYTAPSMGIKT